MKTTLIFFLSLITWVNAFQTFTPSPAFRVTSLTSLDSRYQLSTNNFQSHNLFQGKNHQKSTKRYMAFDFFPSMSIKKKKFNPKNKKTVVITGTTSGLGKATLRSIASRGDWYVICANRDPARMDRIAKEEMGLTDADYISMNIDLMSFDATRNFCSDLKSSLGGKALDALICNAAIYKPADPIPRYSEDGIEASLQSNHLSHFLMISLLLPSLQKAKDARVTVVGSITGNTNSIGGGLVWPRADLGELKGMESWNEAGDKITMIDGKNFNGAKSYKDSKVCNMMTANELHRRYHEATGITFNTMYPGCIAETPLFREKRQWFRTLFPLFMKYVTGGYVSEEEAGDRLGQTIWDPKCAQSGKYWCWNGDAKQVGRYDISKGQVVGAGGAGGEIFANSPSNDVLNSAKAARMWDASTRITGAQWPKPVVPSQSRPTGRNARV